jgi:hypothetical protein
MISKRELALVNVGMLAGLGSFEELVRSLVPSAAVPGIIEVSMTDAVGSARTQRQTVVKRRSIAWSVIMAGLRPMGDARQ